MSAYPNPSNDKMKINIQSVESGIFEIVDVAGNIILQSVIRNPHSAIPINYLSPGIYIYKFADKKKGIARGKIIIQ